MRRRKDTGFYRTLCLCVFAFEKEKGNGNLFPFFHQTCGNYVKKENKWRKICSCRIFCVNLHGFIFEYGKCPCF